jgi:hypothetical protein
VRAEINVGSAGQGSLVVDGVDLSPIASGLTLRAEVGVGTRLVVDLRPVQLSASVDADVQIPESLFALLIKLGWTPPIGDRPAQANEERV